MNGDSEYFWECVGGYMEIQIIFETVWEDFYLEIRIISGTE